MERKQYSIEEVENCRTNAGLTKKQFAEFIKMSYNSLCVFYMGKKKVSPRLTELIRKMVVTTQVTRKPGSPNRVKHQANSNLTRTGNPLAPQWHRLTTIHPAASPPMARADH